MKTRRRFNQTQTLEDRCADEAKRLLDAASALPPGPPREAAIRKARQMETASHLSGWLSSPGLEPPR